MSTNDTGHDDDELRASRDAWHGYADRHTLHFEAKADRLSMHGRFSGIEIAIAATFDHEANRVITRITASPRLALHGYVHVRRANVLERLIGPLRKAFLNRKIHRHFIVRRSSESVARAVLDERVGETLGALLPLFHELTYDKTTIVLGWRGAERNDRVLDDALACVGHLAVVGDRTPYR